MSQSKQSGKTLKYPQLILGIDQSVLSLSCLVFLIPYSVCGSPYSVSCIVNQKKQLVNVFFFLANIYI